MSHRALSENQFVTPQATVRVSGGDDGLYVSNLIVGHENRGQGYGTQVMRSINDYADAEHLPVTLHARQDLHDWYGSLGYTRHPQDDLGTVPALRREPR